MKVRFVLAFILGIAACPSMAQAYDHVGRTFELRLHPRIKYSIPNTDLIFAIYLTKNLDLLDRGDVYFLVQLDKQGVGRAVHFHDGTYSMNMKSENDTKLNFDKSIVDTYLQYGVTSSRNRLLFSQQQLDQWTKSGLLIKSK